MSTNKHWVLQILGTGPQGRHTCIPPLTCGLAPLTGGVTQEGQQCQMAADVCRTPGPQSQSCQAPVAGYVLCGEGLLKVAVHDLCRGGCP